MTELSEAHRTAAALRVPVFARDCDPRVKLDALEEFMLVSAHWAGEIHYERLQLRIELAERERSWERMEGWQAFRRGKTDSSIDQAKAELEPELWERLQSLRWLERQLSCEYDRLDRDATKVSRAYTILQGA